MALPKFFISLPPPDSDKAYAFSYGLGAAIGTAVLSHLLALLIFGIGRFLGFLEDKAGVIEVGNPNNKAPEPATENPVAVDEQSSQGISLWRRLYYFIQLVFLIFIILGLCVTSAHMAPHRPEC